MPMKSSCRFTPDDTAADAVCLVSTGQDGCLRVWNVRAAPPAPQASETIEMMKQKRMRELDQALDTAKEQPKPLIAVQ